MPNVTVHTVLAERVLERWTEEGDAPFDTGDPELRNAFYQGSWGPDLGYFPGGHPFFSDLAHYVRSGELTRELVETARTPRERAFAWGWVTHVLGDQAVHPLVGRAVHEHLHGSRDGFVEAHREKPTHVRLEVGLDAFFSHRHPHIRRVTPAPVFDRVSVGWLGRAYRNTYGLEIDPELLLASHLAATRMSRRALRAIGAMAPVVGSPSLPGPVRALARVVKRALRGGT